MDRDLARAIIGKLGATGTPPEFGIEEFTIGLDRYLRVIQDEYLNGILKYSLSSFKMVTGNYGGGKTHFLYSVRALAFRSNYCVAYVSLNPTECPFDRLELVYKRIASSVSAPQCSEQPTPTADYGIESVIRRWVSRVRGEVDSVPGMTSLLDSAPEAESSSFRNAVRAAARALATEDADGFADVVQWLKGEDITKELRNRHRISERIDKATAFRMLRSMAQWIHGIGFSGLVLLFDEAERGMSISTSRDKRRALDNLRQIVDECGNSRLPGAMLFYAIPDEALLLEGEGGVYEALKQRLRSVLSDVNPVGVRINLEELGVEPLDFLRSLGGRLGVLFRAAYGDCLSAERLRSIVDSLAQLAVASFVYDISYRRLFVVSAIEAFHRARANPDAGFDQREAEKLLRVTSRRLVEDERSKVQSEEY